MAEQTAFQLLGRWNAGSSRRSEKTALTVEEYADIINQKVDAFLG